MPEAYWDAVLNDPRAGAKPGVPIQNRCLSEIARHVLIQVTMALYSAGLMMTPKTVSICQH